MTEKLEVVLHAMPRLLLIYVMGAVAVPASVWLTFWGRGSIEHFSFVFLPAVLLAPVLLLASAAAWLLAMRAGEGAARARLSWTSAWALGFFAVAVVLAPSYLLGVLLNRSDVRAARSYCMMLLPRLAASKEKNGSYPAHVQGLLPEGRPIPRLLQTEEPFYRIVGAEFEFVFRDPSGWDSGHYYFSQDVPTRGHWEEW